MQENKPTKNTSLKLPKFASKKEVKTPKLRKKTVEVAWQIKSGLYDMDDKKEYVVWNQFTPKENLNIGDLVRMPDTNEGRISSIEFSPSLNMDIVVVFTFKEGHRVYLPEACLLKEDYLKKTIIRTRKKRKKNVKIDPAL